MNSAQPPREGRGSIVDWLELAVACFVTTLPFTLKCMVDLIFCEKALQPVWGPVLLTDSQDTYLQANYRSHPCHGWMSGFGNLWFGPTRVRVNGSSEEPGCRSSQVDNSCSSLLCHISLSCRQMSPTGPSLSSPRFSLTFKLKSQAPPHLPRSHFWERAPASYTNLYTALL